MNPRRRGILCAVLASATISPGVSAQAPHPPSPQTAPASTEPPQTRRGRILYLQCRACHELRPGGAALTGPHLGDLLGRRVAAVEGFAYSAALRSQSFVWDRDALERWLASPGKSVPGNTMAFAGIARAEDRAALIAYLETATVAR